MSAGDAILYSILERKSSSSQVIVSVLELPVGIEGKINGDGALKD